MTILKTFFKRTTQLVISAFAMICIMQQFFTNLQDVDFLFVYMIGSLSIWTLLLNFEE